jgi:glycerol-3-phosphate acyltransferase PlsY
MALISGLIFSYLIGSIPTAYIFAKVFKGIDIRKHGSGNVGATNAFRVLGPRIGITVLVLDALKGLACVVFIADFLIRQGIVVDGLLLRTLLGIIAVLGHSFTIFLRFKGGKGMATTLGVLIGFAVKIPALKIILLAEILLWFTVFSISRIVSLASIVSAVLFPIFFIILKQPKPLILMGLILAVFVIIRHKSNIYRLLHNQEPILHLRRKP